MPRKSVIVLVTMFMFFANHSLVSFEAVNPVGLNLVIASGNLHIFIEKVLSSVNFAASMTSGSPIWLLQKQSERSSGVRVRTSTYPHAANTLC